MQVKMAQKRQEFLEKEARIYYEAYSKVYDEVAKLAARNDIRLVLRFNSEEMKQDDRNSVLQGVNGRSCINRISTSPGLVVRSLGGNGRRQPKIRRPTSPRDHGPHPAP